MTKEDRTYTEAEVRKLLTMVIIISMLSEAKVPVAGLKKYADTMAEYWMTKP